MRQDMVSELVDDLYEEFSMSKFVNSSERLEAVMVELANLRIFAAEMRSIGNYFCGGYYEPRNDEEGRLAGHILETFKKLNIVNLPTPNWLASYNKIKN